MSSVVNITQVVRVQMTPEDLMDIACKMDAFWRRATNGDDTKVETWLGDGVRVEFCVDQERMREVYGEFGAHR